MTRNRREEPRQDPRSLDERVAELFSDRFERLEKLQNATRMTEEDLAFLRETAELVAGFERRDAGDFTDGGRKTLEALRAYIDTASSASLAAEIVVEDARKLKKKKKVVVEAEEKAGDDAPDSESDETALRSSSEGSGSLAERQKEFEVEGWVEITRWWFGYLRAIEESIVKAESAKGKEHEAKFSDALQSYRWIVAQFDETTTSIVRGGNEVDKYPLFVEVKAVLHEFSERLKVDDPYERSRRGRQAIEAANDVRVAFEARLDSYAGRMDDLEQAPLETLEDVARARGLLDELVRDILGTKQEGNEGKKGRYVGGFRDDWNAQVPPILDAISEASRDGRLGKDWGNFATSKRRLLNRFLRTPEKKDANGAVIQEAEDGLLTTLGKKLGERRRELRRAERRERWDREFPQFAVDIAKLRVSMQDARLREGEERVRAFAALQEEFDQLAETWETVRDGGPFSRDRRNASPVHQYDILVRRLREDFAAFVERADKATPAPIDRVAFEWREALLDTRQFWNSGTKRRERLAFLRRYGSGDAGEEEISTMLRDREGFESTADSDVLEDLRRRGRLDRAEQERIEREVREGLGRHPYLGLLRMKARDMHHLALTEGKFWGDRMKEGARVRLLQPGIEAISDEDLQTLGIDVAGYRAVYAGIEAARAAAKQIEDQLYEGEPVHVELEHPQQFEIVRAQFNQAEARNAQAWDEALGSPAWGNVPEDVRSGKMWRRYEKFRLRGRDAFKGLRELSTPVIGWIFARRRLDTVGRYMQWLIDENPATARALSAYISSDFSIPKPTEGEEEYEYDPEDLRRILGEPLPIEFIPGVGRSGKFSGGDEVEEGGADSSEEDEEPSTVEGEGGASQGGVEAGEPADGRAEALEDHARELMKGLEE